jgi:hypothetical protein
LLKPFENDRLLDEFPQIRLRDRLLAPYRVNLKQAISTTHTTTSTDAYVLTANVEQHVRNARQSVVALCGRVSASLPGLLDHLVDPRWRDGEQGGCFPDRQSGAGDKVPGELGGVLGEVTVRVVELSAAPSQLFCLGVHVGITRLVTPNQLKTVLGIVGQVSGQHDHFANVSVQCRQTAR